MSRWFSLCGFAKRFSFGMNDNGPDKPVGNRRFVEVLPFAIIVIIVFVILGGNGTIGNIFAPDETYELFGLEIDLRSQSLWEVIKKWVGRDMQLRFRPLYFSEQALQTWLVGVNLPLIYIFGAFTLIGIAWSVHSLLRKLGYTTTEALFGGVLAIAGPQAIIGMRPCTAEDLGYLFFCLGTALLICGASRPRKKWQTGLAFVFLLASCLRKESFILCLPAAGLLLVNHVKTERSSWWRALCTVKYSVCFLALLFLVLMAVVCLLTGTSNLGYAGVDSFSFGPTYKVFLNFVNESHVNYLLFLPLVAALLISAWSWRTCYWNITVTLKTLGIALLVTMSLVVPQCFLYAKSGLYGHYYAPGMLGFALFFPAMLKMERLYRQDAYSTGKMMVVGFITIILLVFVGWKGTIWFRAITMPAWIAVAVLVCFSLTNTIDSLRHRVNKRDFWFSGAVTLCLSFVGGLMLVSSLMSMNRSAKSFAGWAGRFSETAQMVLAFAGTRDPILMAADPLVQYNPVLSLERYLRVKNRNLIYHIPVESGDSPSAHKTAVAAMHLARINEVNRGFVRAIGEERSNNAKFMKDFRVVVLVQSWNAKVEGKFLDQNLAWFESQNYLRYDNGGSVVYIKSGKPD